MTKSAYAPHQIRREQLKPLKDSVIISDMIFDARISTGGIYIPNDNGKSLGIRPRWGRVYAVGPEQQDVTVGQWAMVAHGRWTRGIDVEDESGKITLRRVDPNDIIMITDGDDRPNDESFSEAIHVEAAPSWMQHS